MEPQSRYEKVSGFFAFVIDVAASVLFLLSVLIAGYEVVMRYVFDAPHDWGEELVVTTMLYAIFLAAVVGLREGRHTRVDVLLARLSEKRRLLWEIFLTAITIITCGAYAWAAVHIVQTLKQYGLVTPSTLAMPFWIRYLVLPVSLWLCTLVSIEQIFRLIPKLISNRK